MPLLVMHLRSQAASTELSKIANKINDCLGNNKLPQFTHWKVTEGSITQKQITVFMEDSDLDGETKSSAKPYLDSSSYDDVLPKDPPPPVAMSSWLRRDKLNSIYIMNSDFSKLYHRVEQTETTKDKWQLIDKYVVMPWMFEKVMSFEGYMENYLDSQAVLRDEVLDRVGQSLSRHIKLPSPDSTPIMGVLQEIKKIVEELKDLNISGGNLTHLTPKVTSLSDFKILPIGGARRRPVEGQ